MSKKSKKINRSLPIDRKLTVSKNAAASSEFNPDYSYVKKDLRRIGILAGIFFLVLIALTFVIK